MAFQNSNQSTEAEKSYTTNVVNGNIQVEDHRIKLPKLKWIRMKKHRDIPAEYCLKSSNNKYGTVRKVLCKAFYMKKLTVKIKQKNLIMKMQRYLGLTMQCMG
ncbi:MAG: hypothetical protein ACLUD0_04255 [Eubacterium ramulus]